LLDSLQPGRDLLHLVIVFAWPLLGERITAPALIGGLLITAGAVVIALG
jgi:transporter family protein